LGGGVEHNIFVRRDRHDSTRFDSRANKAIVDELNADYVRGGAHLSFNGKLVAASPPKAHITSSDLVKLGRTGRSCGTNIGHHWKVRVFDVDGGGCIERVVDGFGDGDGDRLADVSHPVARQRPADWFNHG
jgi:hypothetical protein